MDNFAGVADTSFYAEQDAKELEEAGRFGLHLLDELRSKNRVIDELSRRLRKICADDLSGDEDNYDFPNPVGTPGIPQIVVNDYMERADSEIARLDEIVETQAAELEQVKYEFSKAQILWADEQERFKADRIKFQRELLKLSIKQSSVCHAITNTDEDAEKTRLKREIIELKLLLRNRAQKRPPLVLVKTEPILVKTCLSSVAVGTDTVGLANESCLIGTNTESPRLWSVGSNTDFLLFPPCVSVATDICGLPSACSTVATNTNAVIPTCFSMATDICGLPRACSSVATNTDRRVSTKCVSTDMLGLYSVCGSVATNTDPASSLSVATDIRGLHCGSFNMGTNTECVTAPYCSVATDIEGIGNNALKSAWTDMSGMDAINFESLNRDTKGLTALVSVGTDTAGQSGNEQCCESTDSANVISSLHEELSMRESQLVEFDEQARQIDILMNQIEMHQMEQSASQEEKELLRAEIGLLKMQVKMKSDASGIRGKLLYASSLTRRIAVLTEVN